MSRDLHILVGTMYCGEGEFVHHERAVRRLPPVLETPEGEPSRAIYYHRKIIAGKPEVEAHRELYQAFKEQKDAPSAREPSLRC